MNYDDDEDDFPLAKPHSVGCQSNGFLIDFYPHPASLWHTASLVDSKIDLPQTIEEIWRNSWELILRYLLYVKAGDHLWVK